MGRALTVLFAAVLSLATTSPAVAGADDEPSQCSFVVSAPQAAVLPGPGNATGVTATLTWQKCTGSAVPISGTVCISNPASNGRCYSLPGWDQTLGIFPTQHPTGPFTVQARGCYRTERASTLVCDTTEQTATL